MVYNDYTYATGVLATLTTPSPSSLLTGSSVQFIWSAGSGVSQYDLHLSAVAPGNSELYSSGHITGTSRTVSGLSTNGATIYARLYSVISGVTYYNDYTYYTGALAQITSPVPSSTLTGSSVVFTWSAGTGVTQYDLHLSAVAPGNSELYSSGHVTGTSRSVSGLPTSGATIYARLYSIIDGIMFYNDYTYKAQ
jgi:CRISPR/Cas system endoribonuclease Cas6 (RAMP superfamily)